MNISKIVSCAFVCSALSAGAATEPSSAAAEKNLWERDKLTGDWGGLRTDLTDKGVVLDVTLSGYGQRVASGGRNVNSESGGTVDYRLAVDTHKLFGTWEGFSLNAHARTRGGNDVSADAGGMVLQNTGMLEQEPGDYSGTDVTSLYMSQYVPLPNDGLAQVSVGQFDVIDLVSGFFPSVGYGQEGFWNANSMVTALPWFGAVQGLSLFGGMGVTINKEYKAPSNGVLVLGTQNVATSWGSLDDSFNDGVFLAAFHRFFWEMDQKMGYFMVFAGGSTKDEASNDPHDIVFKPGVGAVDTQTHKPWDVAFYLYQDIWQDPNDPSRKANIMLGGTAGPDNPQFAQYHAFANVEIYGLMAARPKDRIGASVYWNGLSNHFKDLVEDVEELQDPWGLEFYYSYELTPWAHITADLQLAENEFKDDDIAIIPGIRVVIDL
jgi:porin